MLNFKKKVWIVKQKERENLTDSEIAISQRITRRHVQRLWVKYQSYGLEGLKEKPVGRRVDEIPKLIQERVLNLRKEGNGIRRIEGLLKLEGIKISHNKIHRFLIRLGEVIPEPKKGVRKKYVRWERKHSNSLWQTDFCWIEKLECWLTAWLDDHSRLITSAEYLTEATTESSLKVFEKGVGKWGLPRETLSDRGTQYYPNRGGTSRFFEHLKVRGVKHIYASIKKPTTCGKLERFWGTHNKERWTFSNLKNFIDYYNYKRPHMSLGYLTPYQIWKRDLKV